MGRKVGVAGLANAINRELADYAESTADRVKEAVRHASDKVKKDISAGAPTRTGAYAKSWRTKVTKESTNGLEITVYSPTRYRIAHLLEKGHAKRGGGRVVGRAHIAPAEQHGIKELETEIEQVLDHG